MNVLFVHQNFPGQYLHLAAHLARKGHRVIAISSRTGVEMAGVRILNYQLPAERAEGTHRNLTKTEEAVIRGERVAAVALRLKKSGFTPDVICAHPGWGEALYLRDIWENSPQVHYCEFFFAPFEGPAQFRPREPVHLDSVFEIRARNAVSLLSLEACDAGVTPTYWQHAQYPAVYRPRISVLHEGINAHAARPNRDAELTLTSGRKLTAATPVLTYVSRNLEPVRGFPEFMQAAAVLLQRNPKLEIVVVGGDEVSYGAAPPNKRTWRETILSELDIDRSRLHFLGQVPHARYLSVLQISSVHVYLTVPFVLSWSILEAMSVGCIVIGSDTAPVREVLQDGQNGFLVDFFDRDSLVKQIEKVLSRNGALYDLRRAARRTVLDAYSLSVCVPKQINLLTHVAETRRKGRGLSSHAARAF